MAKYFRTYLKTNEDGSLCEPTTLIAEETQYRFEADSRFASLEDAEKYASEQNAIMAENDAARKAKEETTIETPRRFSGLISGGIARGYHAPQDRSSLRYSDND